MTDDLWSLVDGPKAGFCCQDAYASVVKRGELLHTSGCPNRCSIFVEVPDAERRGLVAAYPCGWTVNHAGDGHWLHPRYRLETL